MKSLRIAIYAAIALHFLRKTLMRISPDRPRKFPGKSQGYPVQVVVGITYTRLNQRPEGEWSSYDYVRVATCIDFDTASALAETLNDMEPGYGHKFSLINPDREINRYELEVLRSDRIHLLRDNIRKCPGPDRLARMMQSAAISVLMHDIYPHGRHP